jgi:hypothetical protein
MVVVVVVVVRRPGLCVLERESGEVAGSRWTLHARAGG